MKMKQALAALAATSLVATPVVARWPRTSAADVIVEPVA